MIAASWAWSCTGLKDSFDGRTLAVDPRDALSRALTTELTTGQLVAERFGIPLDVLATAPANHDRAYEVSGKNFTVRVAKLASIDDAGG